MRSALSAALVLLALSAACGTDYGRTTNPYPTDAPPAGSVAVVATRTDPLTSSGEVRDLSAVVKDAAGAVLASPSIVWTSDAPAVATVVGAGLTARVTAIDDGTAVISATSGGRTGTVIVTVQRRVVNIIVSALDTVLFTGASSMMVVSGLDAAGRIIRNLPNVRYRSGDPTVVQVSPDGILTATIGATPGTRVSVAAEYDRGDEQFLGSQDVFVSFVAPARFDFLAVLVPESVRPSPLSGPADGVVYLTVSDSGLDFRLAYRELTGRAIGVRIRGPSDANGVAGILADFPIVDEAGTGAVVTGTLTQEFIRARDGRAAISMDSLVALIRNGATYVDVQTGEYFGGEIRGTLVHAP